MGNIPVKNKCLFCRNNLTIDNDIGFLDYYKSQHITNFHCTNCRSNVIAFQSGNYYLSRHITKLRHQEVFEHMIIFEDNECLIIDYEENKSKISKYIKDESSLSRNRDGFVLKNFQTLNEVLDINDPNLENLIKMFMVFS